MDEVELKRMRRKVQNLRKKPQPVQRSPEWYEMRTMRITASECAACLTNIEAVCKPYIEEFNVDKKLDNKCVSHFDTKEEYIIKKCKSFFGENVFKDSIFTLWGKKYEEIATRFYRQQNNTQIIEFGLLPHPRLKWLGASPDGITPDGIMLEIKCPFSRKINGIVPFHYWTQIQIQLEVADLERCDFLECEIKELTCEVEFLELEITENQQKGILINIIEEADNSETKYIYPPDNLLTPEQFIGWSDVVMNRLSNEGKPAKCIYYFIHKWNVIIVNRRKDWFHNVRTTLKETHSFIRMLQDNKDSFTKYEESVNSIKNKKFIDKYNNTVCLIQTDLETDFEYSDVENDSDVKSCMDVDAICLLSES